jgi:hypothetical protein
MVSEKYSWLSKFLTVLLLALTYDSYSFAQDSKCALQKTTPIRIYGETHDSENADKLWQRLLKEADANKTRLLLEATQSEANSDTILKRDLLSELVSNVSDGLMSNVFGIDGEFLKTIDVLGASYLILRD